MLTTKPKAITNREFIESATMFYIDADLEKEFEQKVSAIVSNTINGVKLLPKINTVDGLEQYINGDEDSLYQIISLLNISKERFKRVITMLRIQKKHCVTNEWDLPKIREQLLSDPLLMHDVCELLINGAMLDKYKSLIPSFFLENFTIDAYTLGRLTSADDIRRLTKKRVEGDYNNKIGDSFFNKVQKYITRICDKQGLKYAIKKNIPIIGRQVGIAIPDESSPRLLIDITYSITTSSTQTDYAKIAEKTADKIRELNENKPDEQKIVLVYVVDGVGWIARQSDLNKIERCSNYLLNLKSLKTIHDIINYYFDGGVK